MTVPVPEQLAAPGRRSLPGYLVTPAILLAVLAVLYAYVSSQTLDSISERRVNAPFIIQATLEHIVLTAVSTLIVLLIAVPVGVLLTRPFARRITGPAVAVFNIGQAIPSIGLLVLFAIVWGIGFWPAVVALVAYSALPVLRNTMIGLTQVDTAVIESGRGMGMSRFGVLTRIELPLAVPVILTGLRTALVINVGTASLVALTNAGGLGGIIIAGLVANRPIVTVVGSVLTAVLALFIDYLGRVAEDVLRPKGL
ncbi:ABC transporter permease [Pseudonocardia abyssalis]|uniref:ABC transporter permease n=1 Tax=Pseudonocardia abyssalis TaxID=2792008 RepID=A0ABS6UXW2_9PSEU|nr:ABC transporter permease [Pseudonocardia abyssalis]MBW0117828.1 ABC transporter permease [Pseudonocardia abyssalis]MBW0137108.1 ABC transporter permease [Pseudonocardia abyssalis]